MIRGFSSYSIHHFGKLDNCNESAEIKIKLVKGLKNQGPITG